MKDFHQYLEELSILKKEKKFGEAWELANKGMHDLISQGDEYWWDMYYQLADISAREKKWGTALIYMALVTHYLKRLGGVGHEKFIRRLLKKFDKESLFENFLKLSVKNDPEDLDKKVKELLNI